MKKSAKNPDQLPPHSLEAERSVLGSVFNSPEMVMNELMEEGAKAEWFYDLKHQLLFGHLVDMHEHGRPIELPALVERLTVANCLHECGDIPYLSELHDVVASASNLGYYLEIVRKHWLARLLVRLCVETSTAAISGDEDFDSLIGQFEKSAMGLSLEAVRGDAVAVKEVLCSVLDEMEHYHRGHAQIHGLTLGLEYVDKMLCGIGGDDNNLMVLAARPGMGKTAFALDVVLHVALDYRWFTPKNIPKDDQEEVEWLDHRGVPVAFFSMEMTMKALVKRMLFQRARADMQRFRTGLALKEDFTKLTKASAEVANAPIWIDETGRMTIEELKAKARRLKRQHGIRLFVVDYIQLMRVSGKRFRDDRVQELAEVSGELQKLGKELKTPFLVLAQMNRDYEKEAYAKDRIPRLSDLKDCGAIEQDADIVAFLYSNHKMEEEFEEKFLAAFTNADGKVDWSGYPRRVNLYVAKSRNGPTGDCTLLFFKSCTHFEDYVAWQKARGAMELSTSERAPKGQGSLIDPEDVPPPMEEAD